MARNRHALAVVLAFLGAASLFFEVHIREASEWGGAERTPLGRMRHLEETRRRTSDSAGQAVALRFAGLAIPRNATILSASLQFAADDTITRTTALSIRGRAEDDAPAFAGRSADPTGWRPTIAGVDWSPPTALFTGMSNAPQRTSDLTPVLQEIVSLPGWAPGNAIVLVIAGGGRRARHLRQENRRSNQSYISTIASGQ